MSAEVGRQCRFKPELVTGATVRTAFTVTEVHPRGSQEHVRVQRPDGSQVTCWIEDLEFLPTP